MLPSSALGYSNHDHEGIISGAEYGIRLPTGTDCPGYTAYHTKILR